MPLIEVMNLKYRYPHTKGLVLDGLNFQVEKGEFIGVVGENKAGKSTLCQALVGLVPTMFRGAYGGRLLIGGLEAAKTPVAVLCQKAGLVFQNPFNQLSGARDTVFGEVAFGLQNLGISREEIVRRVEESLKLLDIWQYRKGNPFDLSGGQTQRVAIASIIAMQPEVIVLDEPTSQLDPQGSAAVFQVVEKLAQTGITIIMAEHKMEKLAAYCDKILLLHKGKQIAYDTPARIFSREDLGGLGVEAPIFTKVCRKLSIFREEDGKRLYPVTLEQTMELKSHFPADLESLCGFVDEAASGADGDCDGMKFAPVFQIDKLSFYYDERIPVFENLSLVMDSRPTAIIGQNGAGKTTLAKLLKGLLKPVSGTIVFQGEDISSRTVAQLAGKVGYVFQNPDDQIFKNRVLDEVMVGPLNIHISHEKAERLAKEALAMVGLLEAADENPYDLDLFERKLVAIASVVAMDAQVLILDEPTIAQDSKGRALIGNIVRNLSRSGKLVLAILHDMDFVAEYFERVIVLAHGRVLADGSGKTVFHQMDVLSEAKLEQPHAVALCCALKLGGLTGGAALDICERQP